MKNKDISFLGLVIKPRIRLYLVMIVFLFGFLSRLSIINITLNNDERKNVLIAKTISFSPNALNLPMEDPYVTHPLLNLYATKLGISMFNETKFGVRSIHLLFGTLTLLVVYFLAKEISEDAAFFAIVLLAFDQFHIHVSIKAENNSILFFLVSLAILVFWKAVGYQNRRMMILVGPICGLAFLAKEVSILLFIAFFVYLMFIKKQWFWLKTKEFYISLLLFTTVLAPWIFWVAFHGSSQLIFKPYMYDLANLRLRRTSINFFLIEPISFIQGVDYRLTINWEDAIMSGVSGIVLLIGTIWAIRNIKHDFYKLMLLIFAVFMGVISFFAIPGTAYGEFWWAGLSLIPAICLTASMLSSFISRNNIYKGLVVGFVIYLMVNSFFFVSQLDKIVTYPPCRFASRVDENLVMVKIYKDRGDWDNAIAEINDLLTLCPNDVDDYSLLGWVYFQKGSFEEALEQWVKALEILPDYISNDNELDIYLDQAISRYQQKIRQDPNNMKAQYFLGVLYYYNKMYDLAIGEFKNVLDIKNDHQMTHYYLGLINNKKGMYSAAVERFKKVIDINPNYALAYYNLGMNYIALSDFDRAIINFKKSLEINPDNAESYDQLGVAYEKKGMELEAKKARVKARNIYSMI